MNFFRVRYVFLLVILSLFARGASAFEDEHSAHEHGHASLTIVQEANEIQVVFESPAMNIVGFEHSPSTPKHRAKIKDAQTSLSDVTKLIQINEDAKCSIEHTHITSALLEDDEHREGEEHEEKHDHDTESSHSEFKAEYHFDCANIGAISEIKVDFFDVFSGIEEVDVQMITESEQRLLEIKPGNASIKF
jgi:hypothetical protein